MFLLEFCLFFLFGTLGWAAKTVAIISTDDLDAKITSEMSSFSDSDITFTISPGSYSIHSNFTIAGVLTNLAFVSTAVAPSTLSDCSALPQIGFSDLGMLNFTNAQKIRFQGVTLIADGTTRIQGINPSSNYIFQDSCILEGNTPTGSSTFLYARSSIYFNSSIISKTLDSSTFTVITANFIWNQSQIYYTGSSSSYHPVVFVMGTTSAVNCASSSTIGIFTAKFTGLTLSGNSNSYQLLAPIIVAKELYYVEFQNMLVKDLFHSMNQPMITLNPTGSIDCGSMTAHALFHFSDITTLNIIDMSFTNNTLIADSSRGNEWSPILISNVNQHLFSNPIIFDHLFWTDSGTNRQLSTYLIKIVRGQMYNPQTTTYPQMTITNSKLQGQYLRLISVVFDSNALTNMQSHPTPNKFALSGLQVQNITVLSGYSAIEVGFLDIKDGSNFRSSPSNQITFSSFSIKDSVFEGMRLIVPIVNSITNIFQYLDYSIEFAARAHFEITDFTLENTTFSAGQFSGNLGQLTLIKIPRFCRLAVINSVISFSQFDSVIVIGMLDFSEHLLVVSSAISNNQFNNSSLIYQAPQQYSAADYHATFFSSWNTMYASTRVFFISHVTSSMNTLLNSWLLVPSCPYIFMTSSTFQEANLTNSALLSGGNYKPLLSNEISQVNMNIDQDMITLVCSINLPPANLAAMFTPTFPGPSIALSSPVHYIKFEDCVFSSAIVAENSAFIEFSNYDMPNSFISFFNLKFQNVEGSVTNSASRNKMIMLSNIFYARIFQISFQNLNGSFALFTATSISLAFEFTKNTLDTSVNTLTSGESPSGLVIVDSTSYFIASNNTFTSINNPINVFAIAEAIGSRNLSISSTLITNSIGIGFASIKSATMSNIIISENYISDVKNIISSVFVIQVNVLTGSAQILSNQFSNLVCTFNGSAAQNVDFLNFQLLSRDLSLIPVQFNSNIFKHVSLIVTQSSEKTDFSYAFVRISFLSSPLTFSENLFESISLGPALKFLDFLANQTLVTNLTIANSTSKSSSTIFSLQGKNITLSGISWKNLSAVDATESALLIIKGYSQFPLNNQVLIQDCEYDGISGGSNGLVSISDGNFELAMKNISFRMIQPLSGSFISFVSSNFSSFTLTLVNFYNQGSNQTMIQAKNTNFEGSCVVANNTLHELAGSDANFFVLLNSTGVVLQNNTIQPFPLTSATPQTLSSTFLVQFSGSTTISQEFRNLRLLGSSFFQLDCFGSIPLNLNILDSNISSITITNPVSSFISIAGNSDCMINAQILSSNYINFTKIIGNGSVLSATAGSLFNVSITNSTFENNSAEFGGVIYSDSLNTQSQILLTSSNFSSNNASFRGGILFAPEDYVIVKNSSLVNNHAYISGACFYVNVINKTLGNLFHNNTYLNNSVMLSKDPDVSSQAKYFTFTFNPDDLSKLWLNPSNLSNGTILLTNVTSWSLKNVSIAFNVYDYLDQEYYDTDPNNAIRFVTVYPTQNQTSGSYNCTRGGCYAASNSIVFSGDPQEQLQTYIYYLSTNKELLNEFFVELRACVVGEIVNTVLKTCTICPYGKYSLNLTDKMCQDCPEGAFCTGGNNITPLENYYRSLVNPASVLPCWEGDDVRCLGGAGNPCATGYEGPLCQLCRNDLGYVNLPDGACKLCPRYQQSAAFLAIGLIWNLFNVGFAVYMNWGNNKAAYKASIGNEDMDKDAGGFIRQLMTYFQIISILSVSSPNIFSGMNFMKTISNPVASLSFYMDCAYLNFGYTAEDMLKVRLWFLLGTPFIQFAIIATMSLLVKLFKRDLSLRNLLITSLITVYLLSQPAILDGLAAYLNCTQLDTNDNATFVATYLNVKCDSGDYTSFRNFFVYPILVISNFSIPLCLLGLLWKNRAKLNEYSYRMALGVTYNDFKQETYYWCLLLVLFKIILVMVSQLFSFTLQTKSIILIAVIIIYAIIFYRKNPYHDLDMKRCEQVGIASYIIGILLAMTLQANPNSGVQTACQVLIYLVSIVTTIFFSFFIGRIYYSSAKEFFMKCKMKLQGIKNNKSMKKTGKRTAVHIRGTNPIKRSSNQIKLPNNQMKRPNNQRKRLNNALRLNQNSSNDNTLNELSFQNHPWSLTPDSTSQSGPNFTNSFHNQPEINTFIGNPPTSVRTKKSRPKIIRKVGKKPRYEDI